jgi:hypothetical protein
MNTALKIRDTEAFAEPDVGLGGPRVCKNCGAIKEAAKFLPKGLTCRTCRNSGKGKRQRKALQAIITRIANQQITAAARGETLDIPRLSTICALRLERVGGVEKLCDEWHEQFELLKERSPGSKLVLDEYRALAKMLHLAGQSIDSAGQGVGLSEEEIDRELAGIVSRIVTDQIESDPELTDNIEEMEEENAEYD